jgi:hypothetical protein
MIDKEDFELWLAHPITEAMVRALAKLAEKNKAKWMEISWEGGQADPMKLVELRARYEANRDLAELTVDQLNEELNDE